MRIYGPTSTIDEYTAGDLVIFTGYLYTPDYIYINQYEHARTIGIVLGHSSGYYENGLYRVYWLRTGRVTEVVGGHLKLAYMLK